jgi:uncharacterized protein YjbJ (UPF0337 family)
MNWDTIEGNWKQFKGKIRQQWGKLTDDDLDRIAGKRTELIGRLQERYGKTRDAAEEMVDEWVTRLKVKQTADAGPTAEKTHEKQGQTVG